MQKEVHALYYVFLAILMMLIFPASGQPEVLILNLDENNNSAPTMEISLLNIGVDYDISTNFPSYLEGYEAIFLCLGIYPYNYVLTQANGQLLVNYLNNGGSLYMEGGDTWYYDPPTPVHPMFKIIGIADGTGDLETIIGQSDSFTEGMAFSYSGENSFIDHIEKIQPAVKIFSNQQPLYGTGVAYNAGNYKTIGTSFEFGGLNELSPYTVDDLMMAYLDFFDVSIAVEANFFSSDTLICDLGIVYFYDASSGDIISWNWIFEGAIPGTSSGQNPVVGYPYPGYYDVFLEVSDGVNTSSLYMNDYITVETEPPAPPKPTGISLLCAGWGNTSYNTTGLTGITDYTWIITPAEAGNISGSGMNITVIWEEDFLGDAELQVAGINFCGTGIYSEPLIITRYLPDVYLTVPEVVSISTPPFELTGGAPAGGEYSGTGVTNGIFDPSAAGLGTHILTYTYTDINLCSNSAIDSITVTQFTGIIDPDRLFSAFICPNPNDGSFTLTINPEKSGNINMVVYNSFMEKIWESSNIIIQNKCTQIIQLEDSSPGIYYLQVTGCKTNAAYKFIVR